MAVQNQSWCTLTQYHYPPPLHPHLAPQTPPASLPRLNALPATKPSVAASCQSGTASSWTRKQTWITHHATVPAVTMTPLTDKLLPGETGRKQRSQDRSPGCHTALEWAGFT